MAREGGGRVRGRVDCRTESACARRTHIDGEDECAVDAHVCIRMRTNLHSTIGWGRYRRCRVRMWRRPRCNSGCGAARDARALVRTCRMSPSSSSLSSCAFVCVVRVCECIRRCGEMSPRSRTEGPTRHTSTHDRERERHSHSTSGKPTRIHQRTIIRRGARS
jgi:hypothetical protein